MNIRIYRAWLALALAIPAASSAAVKFFDPSIPDSVPQTVSASGIYSNIGSKTADTALKYFDVNAALWSDGASKQRWIILPPGTHVNYVDSTDAFDYPSGTIFVKNFYHDSVSGDTASRKYWETRLLVNKHDENGNDFWYGFSYKWNAAGTEAVYVGADGFDSLFYYYPKGLGQNRSYKKWTFPSAGACTQCHITGATNNGSGWVLRRSVLGFFPAQLKRPAWSNPSINQITALFNAGVFTGSQPSDSAKKIRFKGFSETIPSTPGNERFAVIDTMARSYLAANCSGCHGDRNFSGSGAPTDLNYDFFRLRPVIEYGTQEVVGFEDLDVTVQDTSPLVNGRYKYALSAQKAGMDLSAGKPWEMVFPGVNAVPVPLLVTPGYPTYSMILYRQFAMRRPVWRDSLIQVQDLDQYDPNNRKAWIFQNPWGSQAWLNDLASHEGGIDPREVIPFGSDGLQMPPMATHMVDTTAMKILGEWVKTYRTLYRIPGKDSVVVGVRSKTTPASVGARIQNRMLLVPESWTGKAQMFTIGGRSYTLPSAGRGRYAIPSAVPSGVYYFKVGNRTFRSSILR